MPYNNQTKRITAPVSMSDVREALGVSFDDLDDLCNADTVNMWSKCKPVQVISLSPYDWDWWRGDDGSCGIRPKNIYTSLESLESGLLSGDIGFERIKPTSYFRLADFEGYRHDAPPPFGQIAAQSVKATSEGYMVLTEDVNAPDLNMDDIRMPSVDGEQFHPSSFGIMLTNGTNTYFASSPVVDSLGVLFSSSVPNGQYTAYAFLCNQPLSVGETPSIRFAACGAGRPPVAVTLEEKKMYWEDDFWAAWSTSEAWTIIAVGHINRPWPGLASQTMYAVYISANPDGSDEIMLDYYIGYAYEGTAPVVLSLFKDKGFVANAAAYRDRAKYIRMAVYNTDISTPWIPISGQPLTTGGNTPNTSGLTITLRAERIATNRTYVKYSIDFYNHGTSIGMIDKSSCLQSDATGWFVDIETLGMYGKNLMPGQTITVEGQIYVGTEHQTLRVESGMNNCTLYSNSVNVGQGTGTSGGDTDPDDPIKGTIVAQIDASRNGTSVTYYVSLRNTGEVTLTASNMQIVRAMSESETNPAFVTNLNPSTESVGRYENKKIVSAATCNIPEDIPYIGIKGTGFATAWAWIGTGTATIFTFEAVLTEASRYSAQPERVLYKAYLKNTGSEKGRVSGVVIKKKNNSTNLITTVVNIGDVDLAVGQTRNFDNSVDVGEDWCSIGLDYAGNGSINWIDVGNVPVTEAKVSASVKNPMRDVDSVNTVTYLLKITSSSVQSFTCHNVTVLVSPTGSLVDSVSVDLIGDVTVSSSSSYTVNRMTMATPYYKYIAVVFDEFAGDPAWTVIPDGGLAT